MPKSSQGYEAWIEVEGHRLEEFRVRANEGNTRVTCWVPCEVGKEFVIHTSVSPKQAYQTNHSFRVLVDGTRVRLLRNTIYKYYRHHTKPATRSFSGHFLKEKETLRMFEFGDLELTDDDAYLGAGAGLHGQISLEVRSVDQFQPSEPKQKKPKALNENYCIHERAKKGLTTCVRFGEEKLALASDRRAPVHSFGCKTECTFVFNYRRIDYLTAQGIAPPFTAIAPGADQLRGESRGWDLNGNRCAEDIEGDLDCSTGDEIRVLEARLAFLREKNRQRAGNGFCAPKRTKRQPASVRFKLSGEVVDLTDLASSRTLVPSDVIGLEG